MTTPEQSPALLTRPDRHLAQRIQDCCLPYLLPEEINAIVAVVHDYLREAKQPLDSSPTASDTSSSTEME